MPVPIVGKGRGPGSEGKEEVCGLEDLETGGQDADDRVRLSVEVDGLPEDLPGSAETALPEAVADHHDVRPIGAILLREEGAYELGLDAEERNEVRGDGLKREPFDVNDSS